MGKPQITSVQVRGPCHEVLQDTAIVDQVIGTLAADLASGLAGENWADFFLGQVAAGHVPGDFQ